MARRAAIVEETELVRLLGSGRSYGRRQKRVRKSTNGKEQMGNVSIIKGKRQICECSKLVNGKAKSLAKKTLV